MGAEEDFQVDSQILVPGGTMLGYFSQPGTLDQLFTPTRILMEA